MTLFVFISVVCAYLLGSVSSAIIVSKIFYHDDIRKHGSGNAGLTNTLRTYGKGAAALVLVGDMLKTALSIFIAGFLLGFNYKFGMSFNEGWCYIAALASVIGHVFPVYYGFKGGKGVLSTATAALILTPYLFLILLLVFIAVVALSKYVSLGSVSVAVLYPVAVSAQVKLCFTAMPGLLATSVIILAILIVWCHRGNLQRISDRTERKLSFKKKDVEVKGDKE
ncbi:MAG: glycerol-3-phosphate 1-O-acyltransferase PlsY [Clostridia bacterium]|nr:glycerol-3-phosphate 1-O-acyltransferase PlsY [Clostridia bacterium]